MFAFDLSAINSAKFDSHVIVKFCNFSAKFTEQKILTFQNLIPTDHGNHLRNDYDYENGWRLNDLINSAANEYFHYWLISQLFPQLPTAQLTGRCSASREKPRTDRQHHSAHDSTLWDSNGVWRQSVASSLSESKAGRAVFCFTTSLQTTADFFLFWSRTQCEEDETWYPAWCWSRQLCWEMRCCYCPAAPIIFTSNK